MSLEHLASAFANGSTKNAERLVLLVLAEACDRAGRVRMSAVDIARRANVAPATLKRALNALRTAKLLDGDPTDSTDAASRLTLDTQPLMGDPVEPFAWPVEDAPPAQNAGVMRGSWTADDVAQAREEAAQPPQEAGVEVTFDRTAQEARRRPVARLVAAAGIETDPAAPLYWLRVGHAADLDQLCKDTALDLEQIIDLCRTRNIRAGRIRRLTQLREHIERAKRRPK